MNDATVFQNPNFFDYTSEDEKQYRQNLMDYLNAHWTNTYSKAELLVESNSHVVYKVFSTADKKPSVLKFFRKKSERDLEQHALVYWDNSSISVPKIISVQDISISNLATYLTHMEFVEGENMLTKFKLGDTYLTNEYGTDIANVLKTIDIPFTGNAMHFPQSMYASSFEKIVSVPGFERQLKSAFSTYELCRKQQHPRLLHGDFRDGNLIQNARKITIVDPGPALGHIATDFMYYFARSFISGFTSHLDGFSASFLQNRIDLEEVKAVALLECARIFLSFNQNNYQDQRAKVLEMMQLLIADALFK